MVNAPTKLKILGKTFTVNPVDPDVLSDGDTRGRWNSSKCTIHYRADGSIDDVKDTVFHEVLHAIDYTAQLELTERQVHALSGLVLAVCRDNPDLINWLLEVQHD